MIEVIQTGQEPSLEPKERKEEEKMKKRRMAKAF